MIARRSILPGNGDAVTRCFDFWWYSGMGDGLAEGTNSMMSDFITEQEKTVWMMKAWLTERV